MTESSSLQASAQFCLKGGVTLFDSGVNAGKLNIALDCNAGCDGVVQVSPFTLGPSIATIPQSPSTDPRNQVLCSRPHPWLSEVIFHAHVFVLETHPGLRLLLVGVPHRSIHPRSYPTSRRAGVLYTTSICRPRYRRMASQSPL
jgi:hypothetical protein